MRPMAEAPKDGTRILLKCKAMHYSEFSGRRHKGYVIVEGRWDNEAYESRWGEWCGTEYTKSTQELHPIGWCPIPEGMEDPQ